MRDIRKFRTIIIVSVFLAAAAAIPLKACGPATEATPVITISSLPAYGTTQNLFGTASGVNPALHHMAIYLFLEGGGWWTKPTFASPCTPIAANGSWSVDVTTGGCDAFATKYAAYLLPSNESCPVAAGTAVPPPALSSIAVASLIVDRNPYLDQPLAFSGYNWVRKEARCLAGPGPNLFSPNNVWVDTNGHLHLAITQSGGSWRAAEAYLATSLGYGEYRIHTIGRIDILDPRTVLGMFTWDDFAPPNFRELDIELSRWSDPGDLDNAQFVVQPFTNPNNLVRFPIALTNDDTFLTHLIEWLPGRVTFSVFRGHHFGVSNESDLVQRWTRQGSVVPTAGGETFRLNLWLDHGQPPLNGLGNEVVITYFAHAKIPIFSDGFELGNTSAWSVTVP
jgi:hypothetical protein